MSSSYTVLLLVHIGCMPLALTQGKIDIEPPFKAQQHHVTSFAHRVSTCRLESMLPLWTAKKAIKLFKRPDTEGKQR